MNVRGGRLLRSIVEHPMCYAVTRLTYDPEHGVEREEVVHVYTDQEIARTPAAYWNTRPDICPGPDTPGVRFSRSVMASYVLL